MVSGEQRYLLKGAVTGADGREVSRADVTLCWQRIRERVPLGHARTSEEGNYELHYALPDDAPEPVLLVVEARGGGLAEPVESPQTAAAPGLTIDLKAPPEDPSEYGTLLLAVTPPLQGIAPADVMEDDAHSDITFLANETGRAKEQIMRMAVAARLEHAFGVPAPAWYAFLAARVPSSLPSSLLAASHGFTLIDALVASVGALIAALEPGQQERTLTGAVQRAVVGPPVAGHVADIVTKLQGLRQANLLGQPYLAGKTTLAQLLTVADLPASKHLAFAQALAANTEPLQKFWATLADGKHGFTAAEVEAARQTLALGGFVKNTLPLVVALRQGFASGTYTTLPDLARLSEQDWLNLIDAAGPGAVPGNIAGQNPASTFAREIYDRVTAAYPTAALASRLTDGLVPAPQRAPLQTFFSNNGALDLRRENLDSYLNQAGAAAFAGIAETDRPGVLANVRAMQRVLRIVPHVDVCAKLMAAGLTSAAAITTMGKQQFVAKLAGNGVTALDAYKSYALARTRYAGVISLYMRFNRGFAVPWPKAFGPLQPDDTAVSDAVAQNATLATLFGSQDYCEVDDCTSILSPAAYLTDLLLWLSNRTAGVSGAPNALGVLLARRPDLGTLLLNCPNTETPMPYIDLVNELLADTASPPPPGTSRQTTLSAAELAAAPDPANANPGADALLKNASYPHILPYDAALDQMRAVLAQSGVALWQLRQAFLPLHGAPPPAQLSAIAGERFGMSSAERALITTANAVTPQVAWNDPNPLPDLTHADTFLAAADISYEQLLELLDVAWTRGSGVASSISGGTDTCDTTAQMITNLDLGRLDLMHRFLRLWRRTGWKMWELDELLSAPSVGDPALAPATLVNLYVIRQLLDATGLSVDQLLAFFQPIDTSSHRDPDGTATTPLYAALFENPAATPDPALAPTNLNGAADLDIHAPAIQAALRLSTTDAAMLIRLTDNTRTLANLSLIYRVATLAQALGLSVDDMLAIGPPTFTDVFATSAATLAFVQRAGRIARAGFSVDQLRYVLSTAPARTGLTDAQVAAVLGDVVHAMQTVHATVYGSADPPYTVLGRQFAQLPPSADPAHPSLSDPGQLSEALKIVDGSFTGGDPARTNFINSQFALFMTPAELAGAVAALTPNVPAGTPIPAGPVLDGRASLVLTPLARYLTQTQVIAAVASDLALAPDVTAMLMSELDVPRLPPAAITLLAALTDPALAAQPLTPAGSPDQFNAVRLLHKASVIVSKLHLVRSDLSWLLANAAVYGGVDLTALPVLAGQPTQPVDALLTTVLLVQLNRAFTALAGTTASPPPAIQSLTDLISAAASGALPDDAHAAATFAAITGAPVASVQALIASLGISLAAGDYTAPATFDRLRTLLAMAKSTGGSGDALASWGIEAPDETAAAASALQALKSRYTDEAWLAAAATLNAPLREHRRDALTAYLTAQRDAGFNPMPWGTDTNSLFDYFLIDTQMSACMATSRVVQAYAAVQLFVQRCLMNLEAAVTVDVTQDEGWQEWQWRQRYRLWQADREIFLWPENFLVEAVRPSRSELFDKLIQEARQAPGTAGALETVVLDYIDGLDKIAHLRVTGMCEDPVSQSVHVVARTQTDPPVFYHRTLADGAWTPWAQIPLNIKAHQVVPAVHRRSLYLFWVEVTLANEPAQTVPAAAATSGPSTNNPPGRHAELRVGYSIWRNNQWTGTNYAAGRLYDAPSVLLDPHANATSRLAEALYSVKVNLPAGNRTDLFIDVFRLGDYGNLTGFIEWLAGTFGNAVPGGALPVDPAKIAELLADPRVAPTMVTSTALHIGRAVFNGHVDALLLRDTAAIIGSTLQPSYLSYAQTCYGEDAEHLLQLTDADAPLGGEPGLLPKSGALATQPVAPGQPAAIPLTFTSVSAQEQNGGALLATAPAPFTVIGPSTDIAFDPASDFVYGDGKRAYYVQSTRYYEYGSQWRPVTPSNPANVPFQIRYTFNRFYHPYTKLFWHEIFNGGLPALYSQALELSPATTDPANGDSFSFQATYNPAVGLVKWGEDNEIITFSRDAAYASYNWELFFHIPLYVAQLLRQNQQFEDALTWLGYVFDPTAPGPALPPGRFWICAPFSTLTTAQTAQQDIARLLQLVNENDPNEVAAVQSWQANPFNPFLVADQRPVAYMKAVVMAYVETLIAWSDNLFATASRENLNEATLLLVRASEIMGPAPQAVPPPPRADASFNQLRSSLDAFANAMVDIENLLPPGGSAGSGSGGGPLPPPQTFYFKIPPNEQLAGYWSTIADRLFKLRHCLNIAGQPLAVPLFDAPLDPGLLAAAEAAGIDLSSVLNDMSAPLPNYRYDVLYAQAQSFTAGVRSFGAQLLAALEKRDASQLALLLPTLQQQLLQQDDQLFQWQVDAAAEQVAALGRAIAVQQERLAFYTAHATAFTNDNENTSIELQNAVIAGYETAAIEDALVGIAYGIPQFLIGASGFGGSPVASASDGGKNAGDAIKAGADFIKTLGIILDRKAKLAKQLGDYGQRADRWNEQANEAQTEIERLTHEQNAASIRLQIAQQQQADHQTMIDNLQQQIDFLTSKFTNEQLYDWMAGKLSTIYFQSYQLAYAMAKRAQRCYRYELALPGASFIQFGYWDSLHQGLLAGEALAGDLLRMHSSYLDLNVRRHEISRIYSLAKLDPAALLTLLQTGACDFSLPETLFDSDYPGHYQLQLKRVSVTVVYPNPGKNDNVTCTLTLVANKVRMNTTLNQGAADPYVESPAGNDPRFAYQWGAVQTIVTSQAQDDPDLFENQIHYQITDPRYVPFEGAGAISDWHLQLPSNNEIDVTAVGDVLIHVLYTALDGGPELRQAAITSLAAASQMTTKLFSAANDFPAAWQAFFTPAGGSDQILQLQISSAKFPPWTRGKTITVTGLTAYALSWTGSAFVLEPQAPLPTADVTLTPVGGTPALIAQGTVSGLPANLRPGTWAFKLRMAAATGFGSLTSGQIGDLVLKIDFTAA